MIETGALKIDNVFCQVQLQCHEIYRVSGEALPW